MVDGNGLENRRAATYRGFESRPLRHKNNPAYRRIIFLVCHDYLDEAPKLFPLVPVVLEPGMKLLTTKLTAAYAKMATMIPTSA